MDRMIDRITTKVLRELEISASLRGYNIIKDAVALLLEDQTLIYHITKPDGLYHRIAQKRDSGPGAVERNIRNAIERSTADDATRKRILGRVGHQTNSEYLGALAEYIRMEVEDIGWSKGENSVAKGNDPKGIRKPSVARGLYYPEV